MTRPAPHATMTKFGFPDTMLAELDHWVILLRPQQVTLGSLVLVCREEATAFPDVSAAAFAELKKAVASIERVLAAAFAFDRINYLMLRMVDPHVHFHVLPRYAGPREHSGTTFADPAWPGPPDLKAVTDLTEEARSHVFDSLRRRFAQEPGD